MITRFRRFYNAVERCFDRRAFCQEMRFSREAGDEKQPKTARQAWEAILPVVRQYDRKVALKRIVSQGGIDGKGASSHWEFFFDLVIRRAKLSCEWVLDWDNLIDDYRSSHIEIAISPFPSENSPVRQLVRDGHLLYPQLSGLWIQERKRLPDLPYRFRDTQGVAADLLAQGLDLTTTEFSLSTGQSPQGRLCWMAQTRKDTYYVPLS